jgi:hypothetical protein
LIKLTAGDCVAILGQQWAESQGICTQKDMAKLATDEQQKLAQWAYNATKPKTEHATKSKTKVPDLQVVIRQRIVNRKSEA